MKCPLIFSFTCFFLSVTTMNSWAAKFFLIHHPGEVPEVIASSKYEKNGEGTRTIGDKATCQVEFYLKGTKPTSQLKTFIKHNLKLLIYIKVTQVNPDLKKDELKISDFLFGERELGSFQQSGDAAEEEPVANLHRILGKDLKDATNERKEQETLNRVRRDIDKYLSNNEIENGDVFLIGFRPSIEHDQVKPEATAHKLNGFIFCSRPVIRGSSYGGSLGPSGIRGYDLKEFILERLMGSKANDNELKAGLLGNHDSKKESFDCKKLEEKHPVNNNPRPVRKFERIKRFLKKPAKFLCCCKRQENN